ncbi:hypothetical protein D918_06660 [Trichuris suis]|nr:hypothetical protein D918_06660 [Trichuris suis]
MIFSNSIEARRVSFALDDGKELLQHQVECCQQYPLPLDNDRTRVSGDEPAVCSRRELHVSEVAGNRQSSDHKTCTLKLMKLWGKLFHFGGNANSSVRQETHCQHVVPLGDGGTVYFGLYGSIRRRRSSKLPYTASSKSASASPCCQRAPSTIELLQDQQKRLATIAATPRMARALQSESTD